MVYISQNDLNKCIKDNLHKLPEEIDLIIANPRSGFNPAIQISLLLNLPICDISIFKTGQIYNSGETKTTNFIKNVNYARKILIVEDSSYSGNSLEKLRKLIPYELKDKCVVLTIYVNGKTKHLTDIYFEEINHSRIFEWNLFHHRYLNYAAIELNTFVKDKKIFIKPTQEINTVIIDKDKSIEDIKLLLDTNNVKYKKISYEVTDEVDFIICKDKTKYQNNLFKIEF